MYDAQIFLGFWLVCFECNYIFIGFFSLWNLIAKMSLDFSSGLFSGTCILLCKIIAPGNRDILLSLLQYIAHFLSHNNPNTQSRQGLILAKIV